MRGRGGKGKGREERGEKGRVGKGRTSPLQILDPPLRKDYEQLQNKIRLL